MRQRESFADLSGTSWETPDSDEGSLMYCEIISESVLRKVDEQDRFGPGIVRAANIESGFGETR